MSCWCEWGTLSYGLNGLREVLVVSNVCSLKKTKYMFEIQTCHIENSVSIFSVVI